MAFGILFNENLIAYIQSLGNPFLDNFFKVITNFGGEPFYFLLASLIFWCFSKKTGIRLMYISFFLAFATIFAKNLFGMPRPPEYLHKVEAEGSGFPSGHALISSGFLGYMIFHVKKRWFMFLSASAVLSVALSRVYLGVHYPGDVAGGILLGLFAAVVLFKAEPVLADNLRKLGMKSKYCIALIIPVLLTAVTFQKGHFYDQIETGIVMASVGVGYLLEQKHIGLPDVGNNGQRIKRAFVGISILAIIYLISSLLLMLNQNFFFVKYAAVGFTSTIFVPYFFSRIEAGRN